jgi:hypothetical protein
MDKLKQQLAPVIQHSFWIMCGGILAVCLVSWYMSTKQINDLKEKQLSEIKTVFDGVTAIRGKTNHPNASTAEGMDQILRARALQVAESWERQYDNQADVLVWPSSFDQRFRDTVNKFRPIEIVPPPPTPLQDGLPNDELNLYRLFIGEEVPKLADTIGAIWTADLSAKAGPGGSDASGYGGGGGAGGGGYTPPPSGGGGASGTMMSGYDPSGGIGGTAKIDNSIVQWAGDNQSQLVNTHFAFLQRPGVPSTLEVLYAQEDLWVLQNIMDIIRAANRVGDRDAEGRHEAAIKRLDFVRIGRSAMGLAGQVTRLGGSNTASGPGGMMMPPGGMPMGAGGPGMSSAMPTPDGTSGTTIGGASATPTDPAFGRYVDPTYNILDPAKLRTALTSKSSDDALLAIAKRMPVRMRFELDQRKLNRVVAECGNARLPVEIRQIRVNRPAASGGGGGGGYGGDMMAGGGDGYGAESGTAYNPTPMMGSEEMGAVSYDPGGTEGGMGGSFMSGTGGFNKTAPKRVGGASSTASVDQNLIEVELYGIVYIYNPVNRSQLGLDQPGAESAEPPTTPAGTEPPSTVPPSTEPAPAVPTTPAPPATTPVSAPPGAGSTTTDAASPTPTTAPLPPAAIIVPSGAASG